MENILTVKNLNKSYELYKGNSQQILKDINLEIKKGEFVSIMGASGSGKSTLLYAVSGMEPPTSGQIIFENEDLSGMNEDCLSKLRLEKMGFIFQQSHLLKNLNIKDNIVMSAYLSKKFSRKEVNKRADELMDRTGILKLAGNDINQASGGQLQRVGICRALINNPDIIFGDEPTGALNSKSTGEIMEILRGINESGTTILLVTHDAKVASKTEKVYFMSDGKIAGEKYLGKYKEDDDNKKQREEELAMWLVEMGF